MDKIKELEKRLAAIYSRLKEIGAKVGGDSCTAEDEAAWKAVNAEFDACKRQLETAQRLHEVETENNAAAASRERESRALALSAAGSGGGGSGGRGTSSEYDLGPESRIRGELTYDQAKALELEHYAIHRFGLEEQLLTPDHEAAIRFLKQRKRRTGGKLLNGQIFRGDFGTIRQRRAAEGRMGYPGGAESRATMTTATDGTLIPESWESRIERQLLHFGPMLQIAEVVTTDRGGDHHINTFNDTANEGVELAEATATGEQEAASGELVLEAYKYTSKMIKVSAELLEDSLHNLNALVGDAAGERLGRILNKRFTTGTGTAQPRGIVTALTAGATDTAGSGALAATDLIDHFHRVDVAYRGAGGWMMNDLIVAAIRKLAATTGEFLWQPGLQAGVPDRLLGLPIFINNNMASAITAGNIIAIIGDYRKYKVRLVRGIRVRHLVERYADSDEEGFVSFLRADGDLVDQGALKALKVKA